MAVLKLEVTVLLLSLILNSKPIRLVVKNFYRIPDICHTIVFKMGEAIGITPPQNKSKGLFSIQSQTIKITSNNMNIETPNNAFAAMIFYNDSNTVKFVLGVCAFIVSMDSSASTEYSYGYEYQTISASLSMQYLNIQCESLNELSNSRYTISWFILE